MDVTLEGPAELAGRKRCQWADKDLLLQRYHDEEWGVPEHDDKALFELVVLEGAQAGLSWRTILHRREGYRRSFQGFNPVVVAEYTPEKVDELLQDSGIIRKRKRSYNPPLISARKGAVVSAYYGRIYS